MSNELFEATHLSAARLNGCAIHVSQVNNLARACILTEAGADRDGRKVKWMVNRFADVLAAGTQCVRMSGSCALNLTAIACGRADVLYERGPHPWDVAAGVLIVERAGGVIRGGGIGEVRDFELDGRSLLAYTPAITDELEAAFPQKAVR